MIGLSDSERISMTGSAVLTHTHVSVCDRRTDYGISVVHTRYSIDLLMRVKTSRELQTSKKAFRHAGRLFETARLRQTKSSSLLNYHTPTRSLRSANTNLLSVPHVCTAFASRGFSVAAPTVWNSLHLAFATLPLPIPSVAFLKLTASSRLLAPASGSPKCLRFGLWLTLCTLNIDLLTY